MNNQFYMMKRIDNDMELSGKKLSAGYYRIKFTLNGTSDIENPIEYSKDRYHWEDASNIYSSIGEFQELFKEVEDDIMSFERMDYVETITYKGVNVPIFVDDYGQCFFCIYDNEVICFGSFQSEYEDDVKFLIDHKNDKKLVNTNNE